jgi:mono/diheme cytochrome c family protein
MLSNSRTHFAAGDLDGLSTRQIKSRIHSDKGLPLLAALLLGSITTAVAEPSANTQASIDSGKELFMRYCTECHGSDGKAELDVIADATDLTEPDGYLNGSSSEEIFRSINEGAGVAMPAFNWQLGGDQDVWHLVHYVRSLWPEDRRPPVAAQ